MSRSTRAGPSSRATLKPRRGQFSALPHFEAVLDHVVALDLSSLRVDPVTATRVTKEALDEICKREAAFSNFEIVGRSVTRCGTRIGLS